MDESTIPIKIRRVPCKRGTRRNKAGDCVEYNPVDKVQQKPKITKTRRNKAPITEEPIEESLIMEAPITEAPITEEPIEESLITEAPITEEPVTEMVSIDNAPRMVKVPNPKKVILDDILAAVPRDSNEYVRQKEKIEYDQYVDNPSSEYQDNLYPSMDDPQFSEKIAKRKEFSDTKYDGAILPIKEQAEKMCKAEFELTPHQIFVKNFLSFQTPYNSLLLYHGLGSGKTCSAIGIAEEMRGYMKQVGIKQRIIVVASPNVQSNFRLQLFDERKLKEVDGAWTIDSCIGDSLIREINPTNLKGITKERVISQIKNIINQYYVFMGYIELSNFIAKKTAVTGYSPEDQKKVEIRNIQRFFNNRLIIIDEVHNIRLTDENKNAKTARSLLKLAKYCENMYLLMLSATPMYNSYKEIVWLVNLMNLNDKRGTISIDEIFDSDGNFRQQKGSQEGGRELLHRKLIGYVSFVRGENPYTFPYRIYPDNFATEHTFKEKETLFGSLSNMVFTTTTNTTKSAINMPSLQLNLKPIDEPLEHLPVYVTVAGDYQEKAYKLIIDKMRESTTTMRIGKVNPIPTFEEMDRFGFQRLQAPLEALNMVYPSPLLDQQISQGVLLDIVQEDIIIQDEFGEEEQDEEYIKTPISMMVGKRGMKTVMNFIDDSKKAIPAIYNFDYKPEILEQYGRIFSPEVLPKYSAKIAHIGEIIRRSKGIVLIYSQYIEGGIVPLALALEEMGFSRYGSESGNVRQLFTKPPTKGLDALTMKPRSQLETGEKFQQAKYVMITGTKAFSPQNVEDIKQVTSPDNRNGELVKVIMISKAGSEGLDFKNIRQVHILEPWYNLNRTEQIIGRAVRNLSHCHLPFEERNVEIYMHSTVLKETPDQEAADVYVYRLANKKAKQIGRVTRLIKETAVDCRLNINQTKFTVDQLNALAENQNIQLTLSTDSKPLIFKIGDRAYTDICDYMDNCTLKCMPKDIPDREIQPRDIIQDTYTDDFLKMNNPRIMRRIRQLFREQYFYNQSQLFAGINIIKQYPIEQIYSALTAFIKNKNEYLVDKYGRRGNLINHGNIYAFQPIEINDENITIFERSVPIDAKRSTVDFEIPKEFSENTIQTSSTSPKESEISIEDQYKEMLADFHAKVSIATTPQKIAMGDKDWYKHASTVINILQLKHSIGFKEIVDHLIRHMVDLLLPADKLVLVSGMYSRIRNPEEMDETETVVKEYLDSKIVSTESGKLSGIVLADKTSWKLYIQPPKKEVTAQLWQEAEPEDIRDFEKSGALSKFRINTTKYAPIIGFVNMYKTGREMVFRIKDMSQLQNSTGVRVDTNQNKIDIIKRLNAILEHQVYTTENSKTISQRGFCVILEMILRQRTDDQFEGKVSFLDPEQTLYNNITKITGIVAS